MFGQFTIQVRNYITTPAPFPPESGRLRRPSNSCQCLALWSDVWRGMAPCAPLRPPSPLPSLYPAPPELALWLKKRSPGEEGMLKDTAKSDCGTSQFVIVVRFKCFCKNVVNLPTLLQSLGALGWYKYSAHSVCYYKLQFQCLLVSVFFFWAGLSFLFLW